MDFGGNGLDLATFMNSAMRNREGDDGLYGGNGLLWIFLLLLFRGREGWNNNGNGVAADYAVGEAVEKAVAQARADGLSDQVITDAIKGNGLAISQLATTLNTDVNAIRSTLCALDKGIGELGGKIGMTGERVINAIQMGDMQLAQQLASCYV